MNKKRLLLITIILIFCIFSLSISVAFIIKETTSNNIITFGDVKMELYVTTTKDNKEIKVDDGENLNITYNSFINRNIIITNIGNHPIFVRVSFDLKGKDKNDKTINLDGLINIIQNDNDWIYKDGWYYYKEELNSNFETQKLLIDFEFDIDEITNKYPGSTFTLDINAEAVQSENNKQYVLDVVGWPSK